MRNNVEAAHTVIWLTMVPWICGRELCKISAKALVGPSMATTRTIYLSVFGMPGPYLHTLTVDVVFHLTELIVIKRVGLGNGPPQLNQPRRAIDSIVDTLNGVSVDRSNILTTKELWE